MHIKAIIFDLDGTLIDSIPDIAGAANQLMINHGFPVHDPLSYIEWIGNGALKLIQRAIPHEIDDASLNALLREYLEIHKGNCTINTRLYPGIDVLLTYLNEHKTSISILTNKPQEITQKVFTHYLSDWKFDYVFGQEKGYPKKPEPIRANEIADKLDILPEEMLFIGDSDTDMKTGVAADMITVGVTWGYDTESSLVKSGAKYLMHSAKELLNFIKTSAI